MGIYGQAIVSILAQVVCREIAVDFFPDHFAHHEFEDQDDGETGSADVGLGSARAGRITERRWVS